MDMNQMFAQGSTVDPAAKPATMAEPAAPLPAAAAPLFSDDDLLDLWEEIRKECMNDRWIFERQWMRNLYYILGRQWIEYHSRRGGWRDKRMAQWMPRPVTNKCKETLQAIRAMLTSIHLGVNVRPNGTAPENVSAASTADDLSPLLHEVHHMNNVLTEFDFWLIVTGNAFLTSYIDYDMKYGVITIQHEQCLGCGKTYGQDKLADTGTCPDCGGKAFQPATNPDGSPMSTTMPKGQPVTCALSPLEVAFKNSYARFEDIPYIVRLRWRPKSWVKNHPILKQYAEKISWQKSADDTSLQLFNSLSKHNDLGIASIYWQDGTMGDTNDEGIPEYEVTYKPCDKYPEGLVFRILGDKDPIIEHLEESEALPGPMPYKDVDGKPVFNYMHAGYEHVGGRVLASGPLDVMIQKQDMLNQLDAMILLIIMRMANPVWLEPKGAEVEKLTGMPGLVIKWNPLTVGGQAKPERIPGEGPHPTLFQIRQQYLTDIEELTGTFDILKGAKPAGVEAFAAMQLLVERSQSRFANVFAARGEAYKQWYGVAIELEREFGPDERTRHVLTDSRQWTYQTFKRSQLQGSITVIVEDGSTVPKTNLGMRAAVEHASQLKMLNMADPDVQYEGLKLFGLAKLVPAIDVHVQAALQKQQAFEAWIGDPEAIKAAFQQTEQEMGKYQQILQSTPPDPMAPPPPPPSMLAHTPLAWRKWYSAVIHRQELLKWANSDRMRELITQKPEAVQLLEAHLMEIEQAQAEEMQRQVMMTMPPVAPPAQGGGAGNAMGNSNREATTGNEPSGLKEGQGPA